MKELKNDADVRKYISKLSWADQLEASDLLKQLINGRDILDISKLPSSLHPLVDYCDSLPKGTRYHTIIDLLIDTDAIIVSTNRTHVSVTEDDLHLYEKMMGTPPIDLPLKQQPDTTVTAGVKSELLAVKGIRPSKARRAKLKMLRETKKRESQF